MRLLVHTAGRLGMQLVEEVGGAHPVVAQLAADGAVEREHRSRVRRGDVVEAVNGWPTTGQPLETVLGRIVRAGRPLELLVTRPLQEAPPPHTRDEQRELNSEFERVLKSLLLGFDTTTRGFDTALEEQGRAREQLHDALDTKFRLLDRTVERNGVAPAVRELARAHEERCALAVRVSRAMLDEVRSRTLDGEVASVRRSLEEAHRALAQQSTESEGALLCERLRTALDSASSTAQRAASDAEQRESEALAERETGALLARRLADLRRGGSSGNAIDFAQIDIMRRQLREINDEVARVRAAAGMGSRASLGDRRSRTGRATY